ncbi:MAG: DNA endonuclease SmrA [Alcanivoracaceae bacterium]|nr:DNA endonuclease SmrA [Alcanivoracaceae bacterium]
MSQQDEDIFLREMRGVRRLPDEPVVVTPTRSSPTLSQLARRQAADSDLAGAPREPLSLPEQVTEVGPHDLVGLKKNGVQEGVYRKLRLGKYEPQSRLDLHRVTLRDARVQVIDFLNTGYQHGLRTVLITHGKGHHSVTPGRMKSYVLHWLEEWDLVLAFHSAKPWHGGAGATYVLLRKAPDASLRNREQYTQGR